MLYVVQVLSIIFLLAVLLLVMMDMNLCLAYSAFFTLPFFFPALTHLSDRYTAGEPCLTEETPAVLSSTSPPGRLLLLPDRHAGRSRALWSVPQCCHQEEFHSVTTALSTGGRSKEVLASKHCPRENKHQLRSWRRLQSITVSVSEARSFSDQELKQLDWERRIQRLNTANGL